MYQVKFVGREHPRGHLCCSATNARALEAATVRFVIADRTSSMRRVHREKRRLCRRIGPPQHDVEKGEGCPRRRNPSRKNVGNLFRDFPRTPPRNCYSDPETKDQSYTTCPNQQVFPNTMSSHVYAALTPLSTNLPVNRVYPFWQR